MTFRLSLALYVVIDLALIRQFLCVEYKDLWNNGRFCRQPPPSDRTVCNPVFINFEVEQAYTKPEAQAYCENFDNGNLPRPEIKWEFFNMGLAVDDKPFFLDAFDATGQRDFRNSDETIFFFDRLFPENEIFLKFEHNSSGNCLLARPSWSRIRRVDCNSKHHFTCSWCLDHDLTNSWSCKYKCKCRNGSYLCSNAPCAVGDQCVRLYVVTSSNCQLRPCRFDMWGSRCQYKCGCQNYQPCDIETGHCPNNQCMGGYEGASCNKHRCPLRRSMDPTGGCGLGCFCKDNQYCDLMHGYCFTGCPPGLRGVACNHTTCPHQKYGENCSQSCICPDELEPCHPVHGTCFSSYCDTPDGSCPPTTTLPTTTTMPTTTMPTTTMPTTTILTTTTIVPEGDVFKREWEQNKSNELDDENKPMFFDEPYSGDMFLILVIFLAGFTIIWLAIGGWIGSRKWKRSRHGQAMPETHERQPSQQTTSILLSELVTLRETGILESSVDPGDYAREEDVASSTHYSLPIAKHTIGVGTGTDTSYERIIFPFEYVGR